MAKTPERKRRPNGEYYSSDPSERMRQLQEDGRVGGEFGKLGGRPRKLATEELAEKASQRADKFVKVLDDLLDSDSEKMRLAAVNKWLEIEETDRQRQRQEKFDELDHDQLVAAIQEMLEDPRIRRQLEYVDGTAEEIEDPKLIEG